MKFCPKCGSIMMPKKEGKYVVFRCSCGYFEKKEGSVKVTEIYEKKKKIDAVEEEVEINPLTQDSECPKCGHKNAYYWEIQTRASDEPATKFLKCEKCKHIWRDYK